MICALRLKGGERIMPSPTMLMIPNSESAPVAGSTDFSADEMRMSVAAAVCRLQWRVRIPDTLRDFEEVTHVDILVSDEMPLSDRNQNGKAIIVSRLAVSPIPSVRMGCAERGGLRKMRLCNAGDRSRWMRRICLPPYLPQRITA